ncbi:MAG TPA: hypothetical protein VJ810_28455 [Blastocatellia bacterium]|nr:hypothetical protein [Blastocatellia bacterium]
MIALYLIEFLLIALIVVALVWAVQRMVAAARSQAQARNFAEQLMRYDEARQIVLQQAHRLVEQGIPFEQAVLTALSDGYWPDAIEDGPQRQSDNNQKTRSGKRN